MLCSSHTHARTKFSGITRGKLCVYSGGATGRRLHEGYHSMLTDPQDEAIERLQSLALKCIFGPRIFARKMRQMAGLQTLRHRRIDHCDKFACKCANSYCRNRCKFLNIDSLSHRLVVGLLIKAIQTL